jgi:hypothetical protein
MTEPPGEHCRLTGRLLGSRLRLRRPLERSASDIKALDATLREIFTALP